MNHRLGTVTLPPDTKPGAIISLSVATEGAEGELAGGLVELTELVEAVNLGVLIQVDQE